VLHGLVQVLYPLELGLQRGDDGLEDVEKVLLS
jgi:hypothetical protein